MLRNLIPRCQYTPAPERTRSHTDRLPYKIPPEPAMMVAYHTRLTGLIRTYTGLAKLLYRTC